MPKSAQNALGRFLTPRIGPYAGEYSLFQKVTFWEYYFCKFQKYPHFLPMCNPISNSPACGTAFSSKTLQVAQKWFWEIFSLQNDQSHLGLSFTRSIQWFWEPKTRFGAQNAFWSTSATSAPQNHQKTTVFYTINEGHSGLGEF